MIKEMKDLFNYSTTDSTGFNISHSEIGMKAVGKAVLWLKGKSSYWEGYIDIFSIDMSEYCSSEQCCTLT